MTNTHIDNAKKLIDVLITERRKRVQKLSEFANSSKLDLDVLETVHRSIALAQEIAKHEERLKNEAAQAKSIAAGIHDDGFGTKV